MRKATTIQPLMVGDKVYRIEKYNHENKVYEYKIIHIEQNRIDGETTNIYYAKCEELVGYATENLLFSKNVSVRRFFCQKVVQ